MTTTLYGSLFELEPLITLLSYALIQAEFVFIPVIALCSKSTRRNDPGRTILEILSHHHIHLRPDMTSTSSWINGHSNSEVHYLLQKTKDIPSGSYFLVYMYPVEIPNR